MCDTIAFVSENGCWLAKNSDRDVDEAQLVEWHEATEQRGLLSATYIQVTAPKQRYACWLSRPSWMWGAEMGVNEYGVAIGNEAVFTKLVNKRTDALLGMDLLRLALEQSDNADQALAVITRYIREYGQGGRAGNNGKKFFYDNSFLIVDCHGGWQLETAGCYWVAKRIDLDNPRVAISNSLSIDTEFDLCSEQLADKAKRGGYWDGAGDFDFCQAFSTRFMPWAGKAKQRRNSNLMCLSSLDQQQAIAPQLAATLRRHKNGQNHSGNADVCMHANSFLRPSQTTQSMITHLTSQAPKVWMTGGSAPCVSLFKPLSSQSNWLSNRDFWQNWQQIYQKSEKDPLFKRQLVALNQDLETRLWQIDANKADKYLDEWWREISQLDH